MMIEADISIIQEVVRFLSGKEQCRITNLSLSEATNDDLIFPNLEIRLKEQMVYRDNVPVPMSRQEFSLLYMLAKHPGWIFSIDQIYDVVYDGDEVETVENTIYCLIHSLRKKIERNPQYPEYIQTVRGSGYKFVIPEE